MKTIRRIITVTLLLFTACVQTTTAQNLESQMQGFFSYNNNRAYVLLSKFVHPGNTFRSGYCKMSGNYLYITIYSTKYNFTAKIHKNGSIFDSIEVLGDTDWAPAFLASEVLKDLAIEIWRECKPETVTKIEKIFGSLNNISSEQLCLAALTTLLWMYPSSSYSSSSSRSSSSSNGGGYSSGGYILTRDNYKPEPKKRFWGFSVGYVQKQWVESKTDKKIKMGIWNDSKLVNGVQAGFRFEPYANFGLGLNMGVFYEFYYSKSKTMQVDGYSVYGELIEHGLYVPLHLCYRLKFNEFQIFAFGGAGADYGIANSLKIKFEDSHDVGYESSNIYETDDAPDWKRFNASYEFGGGLRFKAVQATFTMSKGFLDMSSSGSYKMKQNKPMMINLCFMF